MGDGIAVTPVDVKSFHPIHKLQALTLVVVTGRELDGDGVLVVLQFNVVTFVERLCQDDGLIVGMANLHFFLSDEQLGKHNTGQRLDAFTHVMARPVDTIQAAQQDVAVIL